MDSNIDSDFRIPSSSTGWICYNYNCNQIPNQGVYIESSHNSGYYTYYIATAGEGYKISFEQSSQYSICPKGWKMPSKSDGDTIVTKYDLSTIMQPPANFTQIGYYEGSLITGASWYWLSTRSSSGGSGAYELGLRSNSFFVTEDGDRGAPIRCISS